VTSLSERDAFAWAYNKHWGPYAEHALGILGRLGLKKLPAGSRILDLCCGTGQLAQMLSERGYRVTGIDVSPEMIRFARENAPGAEFVIDDARRFSFEEGFDAVVSTYDSLNHVMSLEDMDAVFLTVRSALKPGGMFLFDLNTEAGYLYHWENGSFDVVEDDNVCVVRSSFNPADEIARYDVTIFRLLEGWQRWDIALFQRHYSEKRIRRALRRAGFAGIRVRGYRDDLGLANLTEESERMFFVCRKP